MLFSKQFSIDLALINLLHSSRKEVETLTSDDLFYHGTDFWMLNDKLSEEEIELQLTEMKAHGVNSFIARTYVGIISDYPGSDFKLKMRKIICTAKKLGMKMFLQAGYMPEHVPNLKPEFKLRYIDISPRDDCLNIENTICSYNGFTFSTAVSDSFLDMFSTDAVAYYLKVCYEDMWAEFSHEYGKTITSIWVDEPSYDGNFLPYPHNIEDIFERRWGYSLKENVYKLFFDVEDYESVRYHYRKLLQDMLEESYFKQLSLWCKKNSLLSSGHLMMEDTMRSRISRAGACMPYYRYFDIPGIDILGAQMNWIRNPIKPIGETSGAALPIIVESQYITTPIQCCSVSRQFGTKHTLCEMYGVISQDMTFRNQRYLFDYMAVYGINHRCVHGIFYSLRGRRKRAYPPQINYYQPYWEQIDKIYSYVANVSRFISNGHAEADALIIHPLTSAYCEYTNAEAAKVCGVQPSDAELEKRDRAFLKLVSELSFANVTFDLGDEKIIEDCGRICNDCLIVGNMSYKTVVLPDLKTLSSPVAAMLKKFVKSGGRVIILGNAPYMTDGFKGEVFDKTEQIIYIENDNLPKIVHTIHNGDYTITSADAPGILSRRKTDGDKCYYLIFNADCSESKEITLTINDVVSAQIYDGFSGLYENVACVHRSGRTEICLTIPEGGSLMLKTKRGENQNYITKNPGEKCIYKFNNTWHCKNDNPNVLLLEFCRFKKPGEQYSPQYPTLAVQEILTRERYEGDISLSYSFQSEDEIEIMLALENVNEQEIYLNEEKIPTDVCGYYLSRDFAKIRLPKCKKGENTITIKRKFSTAKKTVKAISSLFTTEDGTELENIYLLGDFSVKCFSEFETNGSLKFNKNMTIAKSNHIVSHEITQSGYPFYAGTMELSQDFELEDTGNLFLVAESFCGAVANVYINGILCGDLHCSPYRINISNAVKRGSNNIRITLCNTLRNLLGPHHRPHGEEGNLFLGGYGNHNGSWTGNSKNDPLWFDNRYPDTAFWTESYMQVRFGIKNIKIFMED